MSSTDPLILTLQLDEAAFERFERLRRQHFPKVLNQVPAHVTLFHALPGPREEEIVETLAAESHDCAAPEIDVPGLLMIGRGVAFTLESAALRAFRDRLATRFADDLTPQDRAPWRPHVTVQNKVAPDEARALHAELERDFTPFRFMAPGLLLWRYRGGPWEPVAALLFGGDR